jgi:hypothetical protein
VLEPCWEGKPVLAQDGMEYSSTLPSSLRSVVTLSRLVSPLF